MKTSEAGILLIMPYWPRLYTRLSNDQDRRVREMAQKAHWVGKYTLRHFLYWSRLPIIFLRLIPKLCWLTKSRLRHSIWKSAKKMCHIWIFVSKLCLKLTFDVKHSNLFSLKVVNWDFLSDFQTSWRKKMSFRSYICFKGISKILLCLIF
mgnify:CR=1 FL=1